MSLLREIEALIEDEVEKRLKTRLCKYAENITKVHGIPMRLLLRDIPSLEMGDTICKGILKNGERCSRRFKTEGYCILHLHQKKAIEPIHIVSDIQHNHTFPPLYKADCPACQANTTHISRSPTPGLEFMRLY